MEGEYMEEKKNKLCVLITGVGGFVGHNVAEYLADYQLRSDNVKYLNKIDIIGLCHSRKPSEKLSLKKMVQCNLYADDLNKALSGEDIDVIIHCASQMKDEGIRSYLYNTVDSTKRLLDYAETTQVKTFIYLSSISVYGETFSEVEEAGDMINLNDYGITKRVCERLVEDSKIERRFVIRLPRILGKRCDLSYPWIPLVTGKMIKGEDVYYTNPNLLYNNLLYVDDLSKFLLLLLEKDNSGFDVFVLGAKEKMRIIDILETLKSELSSSSKLIEQISTNRNKCYAINTSHAENYGFVSRKTRKIIEDFALLYR